MLDIIIDDVLLLILTTDTSLKSISNLTIINSLLRKRILSLTTLNINDCFKPISNNHIYASIILHKIKLCEVKVGLYNNRKISKKYETQFLDKMMIRYYFYQALNMRNVQIVKDFAPFCHVEIHILESIIENPGPSLIKNPEEITNNLININNNQNIKQNYKNETKQIAEFYYNNIYYIKYYGQATSRFSRIYNMIMATTSKEALDMIKKSGSNDQKQTNIRLLFAYFDNEFILQTLSYYIKRASSYIRDIIVQESMRANNVIIFNIFYREDLPTMISYCDNIDMIDHVKSLPYDDKCRSLNSIVKYFHKINDLKALTVDILITMIKMIKPIDEIKSLIELFDDKQQIMECIAYKVIQYHRLDIIEYFIEYCPYAQYGKYLYNSYQLSLLKTISPITNNHYNNLTKRINKIALTC